jgi:imidazole glycerol phosphate synthase subunit HisF
MSFRRYYEQGAENLVFYDITAFGGKHDCSSTW